MSDLEHVAASPPRRRYIRAAGDLEFQMTPMIDVVFLLLIFFICTTQFPEFEGKFDVRLPDPGPAPRSAAAKRLPTEVVVRVHRDGRLTVNGQPKTEPQLARMLARLTAAAPRLAVVIAGDRDALHQYVVLALNACYQAGVTNISFAKLKPE